MSSPYESSRRRGVWSHWVPLVVTVTVATVGVAAWVWSQRSRDDEDLDEHEHALYQDFDYGDKPPYDAAGDGPDTRPSQQPAFPHNDPQQPGFAAPPGSSDAAGSGWGAHMSGALRRTPSPQQFFDSARKTVAAGVTAASVAVGSALAAIREEDKTAYADHETWSEEADSKEKPGTRVSGGSRKNRKTVAIVVSAESLGDDVNADVFHEHASILSHIPRQNDFSAIKLFVMIYAPGLKDATLDAANNLPPASLSSSFSNIEHYQAQTPGDETKSPLLGSSNADPAFNAVYSQAMSLVEKESMILPFTSPSGHAYILRHLQPDVIYMQESLAGENGSLITQVQSWFRHDLILVVGAEGGHGGLADSESEAEGPGKPEKWWQREDRVGRGRGVVVVDGMRVHDDWARRVQGKE